MAIWLLEGLPGSGKSTMAAMLCALAGEAGMRAAWYREECADHPVHPPSLTTRRRDGHSFIDACLNAWSRFTAASQGENIVHILEGSAFQSTVRFMMEERLGGIEDYFLQFEEIVSQSSPRLVYLRPLDPLKHSRSIAIARGTGWTEKVSGYLERTPYSISRGFAGIEGMHGFWAEYVTLCDRLVARPNIPTRTIRIVPEEWERHTSEAAEFLGIARRGTFGEERATSR